MEVSTAQSLGNDERPGKAKDSTLIENYSSAALFASLRNNLLLTLFSRRTEMLF